MKRFIKNVLMLCLAVGTLASCEKEEVKAVFNAGAVPTVTLSSPSVVLTKDNADKDALTISWAKPDFGFNAAATYTIVMDKKGGNFSNGASFSTGSDLKKTFKGIELNAALLKLGLKGNEAADVDIIVQAVLGPNTTQTSARGTMKATPFLDKLDLSSIWGVVGSATPGGWNGPDVPFYKSDKTNVFVAYANLEDGEIKFRQDNKWDVNFGGTNGVAEQNGANIAVKKGSYRITFDFGGKTFKVEKFSWGVVGSATPSGWAAPDVPFWYDPCSDQWRAIAPLKDGEIKFRQNEDWAVNFGDDKNDGVIDPGGANIAVKAGMYLITVDFKTNKYTIAPLKVWGLVGSATPNGWNGPDTKFRPDFCNEGIWTMSGIKLIDGEIKVRQNDAWDINYGDDGANGSLELNGANIAVKAGTYDITLDFTSATAPKIKVTKK
jgi:starch-binding outer membrane protein SusE/F